MSKKNNAKSTATAESVETAVVPSEESAVVGNVITGTETAVHTCKTEGCNTTLAFDEAGVPNFSPVEATGKFAPNCKPCNVAKSKAWTDANEAMRKKQARARGMLSLGILAVVPTAAEYRENPDAPIMTHRYAVNAEGQFLTILTEGVEVPEGATVIESYNADERYDELVKERDATREANKANREKASAEAKQKREKRRNDAAAEAIRKANEKASSKVNSLNSKALEALKAHSASGNAPTA